MRDDWFVMHNNRALLGIRFRDVFLATIGVLLLAASLTIMPVLADTNDATTDLAISCDVRPEFTPADYSQSGVPGIVPGEQAQFVLSVPYNEGTIYQDILTRPDGSTYYASYLELISLPSNLILDPTSIDFLIAPGSSTDPVADGVSQTLVAGPPSDPSSFALVTDTAVAGQTTWRVLFPGDETQMLADQDGDGDPSYTVPAGGEIFVMTFTAQLPVGATWGAVEDGSECFATTSTGPSNRDTDRVRTAVAAIIPELEISKTTPASNAYVAGGIAPYEFTATVPLVDEATGSLTVAPARDVELVDDVPNGLIAIDAAGNPVADGGTTSGGGVWDETARTVTYTLGDMNPGDTISIDEEMQIATGVLPATLLTNDLKGIISYMPGSDPDDTIVDPADTDDATVTVASSDPAVSKEAEFESYGVGLPFDYTVVVDIPGDSEYYNFTILDTLPDGMQFLNYISATCTPTGATCPDPITTLAPTVFPSGGGTGIGWYPNALPGDVNPRQIELVYEVQLDPAYFNEDEVLFFDSFTNDLEVQWNTVDRLGVIPPATASPPSFDGAISTSDDIIYDRPILQIDKTVTTSDGVFADEAREGWDFEDGDLATYTSVITNVGSRDAVDLTIVDVPVGIDIDPATVTVAGAACVAPDCTWDGTTLTVSYAGPVAPAGDFTIEYTASPTQTGDLDNQINIPTYSDTLGTAYTESPGDTVPLSIPDPVLTIDKDPSDGVVETGVANSLGTKFPFTFTVTNTGAVTAYNPIVTDVPPANVCVIAGGLDAAAAGTVTETAPGVFALDAPLAPGASVTFDADVEVCGPIDAGTYENTANLTWEDLSDGTDSSGAAYSDTDPAPLVLEAPQYEVTKGPAVDAGATINWTFDSDDNGTIDPDEYNQGAWTIIIENTSTVPIGGLVVDDPMPDPFEYNPGDATVVWIGQTPDTFTDNSTASGTTVLSGYTEQLDFEIGQLQAGAEIRITVPFSHNGLDPSDGDLTRLNTVQVTNDNITFDPTLHEADGEYSLIPIEEGPTLAKTVDEIGVYPGVETIEGAPGKQVDFSIDLTIPTSTTLDTFDVWVLDELPDGLTLANEPAANAVPSAGGWTVSCISGPCGTVSEGGAYLGSQPGQNGKTELAWFIGDVPPDAGATPIVMRLTFRAEVEANFDDGSEVIDGLNDPLVNQAFPIFNRSNVVPGGSGNVVAGLPATFPSSNDYDRVYPKDPAEVDLVTPRLDIEKTAYNADGDPVQEINAGDEFSYEVKYTNVGSGPAFDIDFNDDLANPNGIPFAIIDQASLVLTVDTVPLTAAADGDGLTCLFVPFGPNGGVHLDCEFDGPLLGDTDGPSGPALGGQIVITYDGTTVDNDDFFAQFSTQNFDPMFIRNTAMATEYFESAGEGGNQYATGFASTRLFAFTPKPEIDMWCVGGSDIIPGAPAGSDVQFRVVVGNGDKVDVSGNADGDTTLTPFPQVDIDGDGYPEAGFGFNPVFTLTIQDSYVFNGVQGTGPGWGDPSYTNYTPFAAPDQILDEVQPNTYTLVWDSLPGIPHSPGNDEEEDFLAWYDLLIDVTKTGTGGASFWFDLTFTDADGNADRGANVGEYFELAEKDRTGCPGGPPPRVWKTPDADDGVSVLPGQATEFVMYIQQPDEDPMAGNFIDNLPDGLIYAGDLLVTDPLYAVATMDVVPPTWTDDNDGDGDVDLEDYFISSTAQPSGDTTLLWEPPPLPQGLASDPNNGDTDTRWIIRVPVVSEDPVPYPFELVVNGFTWDTVDFGPRSDTGVVTTDGGGRPDIQKRVANKEGPYGSLFTYTIDVTFPSGYAGTDVIIYDEINRVNNWEGAPYTNQELGNMNSNVAIFPVDPPVTYPNTAGELSYAHYGYTPAEFTLDDYVSDFCVVGCSGAADAIDAVPMTPQPVAETLTNPLSTADPYYTNANGAIGWYLGDIEPDPEGQDRVVRLTYTVEAPTITEQRQRVIEQGPTPFPGGTSDPLFDDVEGYWMWELSQVNHPNLVQLRSWGGGNPELAVWEGGTDTDWQTTNNTQWGNLSGSSVLDSDDTYVTVAYPLITMDKNCGAINDPNGTNPVPTPIGSANITCELTLENNSPVDAYDVTVTDTPLTDCVVGARSYYGRFRYATNIASSNHSDPIVDGSGTGRIDPLDPDVVRYNCDISGEFVNDPELTSVPNTFPASWLTSLAPDQQKTFTYQMRVDGWTEQPAIPRNDVDGTWEIGGAWTNDAVLQPWADEPGGVALGSEIRVRDEVFFHDPFIHISKFPYPADRDLSVDAGPFPNYLTDDAECAINNLWPFYYKHDCGTNYNPANTNMTAARDYGDPYAGDYWMNQQPDAYDDLLQPPSRAITPYSWVTNMRGGALGHHYYAYTGWTDLGDYFDVPTANRGWIDRPLNDPDAWAEAFDVEPTQPYTWAIDIRIDGMERLESIDIEDQLPFGWDYVPGSARVVDGNWFLGYAPGLAEDNGITPGYGLVPIPDPVVDTGTEGACSTSAWHDAGPTMTWEFERDTAGEDQLWEYRYVDSRERYSAYPGYPHREYDKGEADKSNWIRIHYDAVADPSILACDPDTSSSDTWFMENNVSINALRDFDAGVMTDTYRMLAPVPNPVALEKLPDDDYVSDETVNEFTISFTNDLDVPVEDITFTDELSSAPVAPLPGGGYDCGAVTVVGGTGFTESCVGGLGSQTTSLEWFFSSIAPGETVVITMPIIVPKDETNLLVWDNTVSTTVKEYYDAPLDDGGKITVVNASPPPVPSKTSTPNPATVNDVVDYEVSFTANRYQVFFDLAYVDTIPDGLTFESFEGISCSGSCPAGFTDADVLELTPVVNADGTTTLWWFFGDLPGSGTGNHTWTMSYRARVDDTYNDGSTVLDEDVLTNVAQGFSNEENLLDTPTGIPSPADWTTYPPSVLVEHDLDIEEPELAIAKSATPSSDPLDSSGTVTFQVEITNNGGTAAYAVEVSDTPNGALENITMDPTTFAGSVVTVGWTATDPTVGWFIPVIQPGETAIFTYVAEVADGFLEEGYPAAENDAEVETYRARPGVDPEPGDRFYGGEEVSVAVDLAGPQLEMQKYVGGCTDDFAFTSPGTSTIWCLEVENIGGAPAYGAVVNDTLPYQWLYDAGSTAGSGGWTVAEPTLGAPFAGVQEVSWAIGDLIPGDVMQITFTATAGEDAPLNVTNWAVVNSFQSDGSPLPPTVTGASDDDPASAAMGDHALEIAKTPDRQQWGLIPGGGTVTWTLTVTNPAATSTNTNLLVTDTLPVPLTYSTWSSTDPRVSLNGANAAAGPNGEDVVVWDISDLAAGESVDILITATVPPATPVANQWYVNDSEVQSDEVSDPVVNQAKVMFFEPASLGNFTWLDSDSDGIQDGGEPGLDGITVNLLDANGDQLYRDPATGLISTDAGLGWPAMSVVTGDDPSTPGVETGWYGFDELPPGTYRLEFVPTAAHGPTVENAGGDDAVDSDADPLTGLSHLVVLDPGEDDPTIDAGFIPFDEYLENLASIDIEKDTNGLQADVEPGPVLAVGDAVTWTYEVTNTGPMALADAQVVDSEGVVVECDIDGDGNFDNGDTIPLLRPNESVTCEGTGIATGGQYENTASIEGSPVLPDLATCGCDLGDPSTWPTDPAGYEPATGPGGEDLGPVTDDDPSHYFGAEGGIAVEKFTNGAQADTEPGPVLAVGDAVTWTYVVTNTSTTALSAVAVTDSEGVVVGCDIDGDFAFDDGNVIPVLIPGQSVTCQGTGTATAGQYQNTAITSGTPILPDPATCGCDLSDPTTWPSDPAVYTPAIDVNGDPLDDVSDTDPSHYYGSEGAIDVEKTTNGLQADIEPGPVVETGDAVTWTYVVTNDTNTAIVDATVTDSEGVIVECDTDGDFAFDDGNVIPLLLPGDSVTCEGTGTATDGQYENTASVSGTPVLPDPTTCGCDLSDPDTWPTDPTLFTDPVDESGNPLPPVTDDDPSHYFGFSGGIDVEKWTDGVQADTEPGPVLDVGDTVTWTYRVTNTSTAALTDVVVTDSEGVTVECDIDGDFAFDDGNLIPLLVPGASVTCEGTGTVTAGQYENTAATSGTPVLPDPATCGCDLSDPTTWPTDDPTVYTPALDESGDPIDNVTDTDPSHYFGDDGEIGIEKSTNGVDADVEPGPAIDTGDPVTWTYVVTNDTSLAIVDATVTDSEGVIVNCDIDGNTVFDDGNVIPLMLPGDEVTCQGTGIAVDGQYSNTGAVSGTPVLPDPATCGCDLSDPTTWPTDPTLFTDPVDENGDPLPPMTGDDPSHYFGESGGIDIEKWTGGEQADTPTGPVIQTDGSVTWTYVVTNTSTTALTDVVVTDSQGVVVECDIDLDFAFDDGNIIPLLGPTQSTTCQGTGTATPGQYQNIASTTGTPILPDPATCGCDLDDPTSWPNDVTLYTNAVDEFGDPLPPVIDADPSHYYGADGNIDINKSTNGVDADAEPGPAIDTDAPVTWTYVVTNATNMTVINASVTDSQGVVVNCDSDGNGIFDEGNVVPLMLPGDEVTCEGTGLATDGQYQNDGAISGTPVLPDPATCGCDIDDPTTWPTDPTEYPEPIDPNGDPLPPVTDDDPSHFFGVSGGIDVEKWTDGVQADTEPGPVLDVGDTVIWTYMVRNTSTTALIDVVVTDSQGVTVSCDIDGDGIFDDGNAIALLIPEQAITCQGIGTVTAGQYENTADSSGTPVLPDPTTCDCDLSDPTTWPTDDPTVYTPAVDENGDPLPPFTDADPSHYFGNEGEIDIEKSTNGVDADIAPGPGITVGEEVTWTYVITNTTPLALANATVTDDQGVTVNCDSNRDLVFDEGNVIPILVAGESVTCEASGIAVGGPYTNLGSVVGTPVLPDPTTCGCDLSDPTTWPEDPTLYEEPVDENGDPIPPIDDEDPSNYFGEDPGLGVEKSTNTVDADAAPGPGIAVGDEVTWTYVVTNTGFAAVLPATVTDSQAVSVECDIDSDGIFDGTNIIPLLLPGQEVTCQGIGIATDGQYQNIGLVSGPPHVPNPATCGCDLDDPTTWPTNPFSFEPLIDPITGLPVPELFAQDPSHYFGTGGTLELEKSTNGVDADEAPGPEIAVGADVTWSYVVTNNTTSPVLDVTVGDDQGVVVDCGDGTNVVSVLLPGQSVTCEGTGTATAGQYTNIGDVSAIPAGPNPETCGCDPTDPTTWPEDPEAFVPLADPETGEPIVPVTGDDPSGYLGMLVDLTLDKKLVDVTPTTATFEFVTTSNGPDIARGPIEIVDQLPAALSFASYSGSDWFCSADGQTVTCSHPDDLPAGMSSPTLTIATNVDALAGTDIVNNASTRSETLGSPAQEADPTNNGSLAELTVPAAPTPGPLAFSGSESSRIISVALLMILLGTVMLFLTRSKKEEDIS